MGSSTALKRRQANMPAPPVNPYRVLYAPEVQDGLDALIRGAGQDSLEVLLAFRQADYLLKIYPQFGEPIYGVGPGMVYYAGGVRMLFIRYVVDELERTVIVLDPIKLV